MNKTKPVAIFAAISMIAGIAFAQQMEAPAPSAQPATPSTMEMNDQPQKKKRNSKHDRKGKKGKKGDARREQPGGGFAKLRIATTLDSLKTEQKAKIDAFVEQHKPEAQALREEMRTAIQQARQATDRQARRALTQPVRQKFQAAEQKIDTFLKGILTADQLQEIEKKAASMKRPAGNKRMRRGADDRATTGTKGRKTGKDGKRWNRENKKDQPTKNKNAATTVTASGAVNPFTQK